MVTLKSPKDWDYTVLRIVTAQSVTGTGVVSEFASSFTDLFGMQSKKYNTKIKAGEDLCKAQLRLDAVSIGANAIIATDIDDAEVGGDESMLMVCMAGTAIRLANPGILAEDIGEKFSEMDEVAKQLFDISKYSVYAYENPY
ncbi:heavy metal-binding domain-containing protein [Daejeonella oryzae]|uniref:heavy metal-binding domain-containing protein n=1 Tax=Daejeonella oryzae TaxID=1122943 RepID=UPI000685AAF9|nr:heavy metal-binding domain-containing protein [Daejeonella oryzae]